MTLTVKKKVCHQLDDRTQLSVKFHKSRPTVVACIIERIIKIIIIINSTITIVGQILGLLIIRRETKRIVGSLKFLRISDQQIGTHQIDYHSAENIEIFIPMRVPTPIISPMGNIFSMQKC